MKLLLSSDSELVFEQGFDLLGIPTDQLRVAHITTASKGSAHPHIIDDERKMLMNKYHLESYDIEGKTKDQIDTFLSDKNVIYVQGGNTFYLLRAIKQTGFDKIVKAQIALGKTYIGVSAGSYIACPTIEMATWRNQDRERFGVTDFTALNLVPFLIRAHYESSQSKLLKEKINKCPYEVKILTDKQAILVEDDKYTLVGDRNETKL